MSTVNPDLTITSLKITGQAYTPAGRYAAVDDGTASQPLYGGGEDYLICIKVDGSLIEWDSVTDATLSFTLKNKWNISASANIQVSGSTPEAPLPTMYSDIWSTYQNQDVNIDMDTELSATAVDGTAEFDVLSLITEAVAETPGGDPEDFLITIVLSVMNTTPTKTGFDAEDFDLEITLDDGRGQVNHTLAGDTLSALGKVQVKASTAYTLIGDTLSATASSPLTATVDVTLGDDTLYSRSSESATVHVTLNGDTVSATASVTAAGQVNITLNDDTVASTAKVVSRGTVNVGLTGDSLVATAAIQVKATTNVTLGDDTLEAGSITTDATVNKVLNGDSLLAIGALRSDGALNINLGDDTLVAYGVKPNNASLTVTNNDDTLQASTRKPLSFKGEEPFLDSHIGIFTGEQDAIFRSGS